MQIVHGMFDLPEHLAERCRLANSIQEPQSEGPIIVWLKSSLRTHENPAIDAGRILSERFARPLLVYQGIDERIHTQTLAITTFSSMPLSTCTTDASSWALTTFCMLQGTVTGHLS